MHEFLFLLALLVILLLTALLFMPVILSALNSISDFRYGESGLGYKYTNSRGLDYYLHLNKRISRNGKIIKLYYFSNNQMDSAVPRLPEGYQIVELSNGVPILKLTV